MIGVPGGSVATVSAEEPDAGPATPQAPKPPEPPPPEPETPAEPAPGEPDAASPPEAPSVAKTHAGLSKRIAAAKRIEERAEAQLRAAEERTRQLGEIERRFETADEADVVRAIAKARGVSENDFIRRAIQAFTGAEPKPEEKTAKELEELRREQAAIRADRETWHAEQAARERTEIVESWQASVVEDAKAGAESFPLLSDLSERELASKALAVASEYSRRTGEPPDTADLLAYLEEQEAAAAKAWEARLAKRKTTGADKPRDGATDRIGANGSADRNGASSARTLSNRDASDRSAANGQRRTLTERERLAFAAEAIPD